MKKLIYVLSILASYPLLGMELPEKEETKAAMEHMPPEIKQIFLANLATAKTGQEAIENILNLMKVNKAFAAYLNDIQTNSLLIAQLAEKYFNNNPVKAAIALNTKGAKLWLAHYLATAKKAIQVARSPLFDALRENNTQEVINLINAGLDPNLRDAKLGRTALMVAAGNNNLNLLEFLLTNKAIQINAKDKEGLSALIYAARAGNLVAANRLLDAGALIEQADAKGFTPLHWALHRKHPRLALELLQHGANPEATDLQGTTPLFEAATHELPEAVKALLNAHVNVNHINNKGYSALILAADHKKHGAEIIDMLLKAGADPLVITPDGETALLSAAYSFNPANIELLLHAGADELVNQPDLAGITPLMTIAGGPDSDETIAAIQLLLDAGADVNAIDTAGMNALHWATLNEDRPRVIEALLTAGTNPNVEDTAGNTPLINTALGGFTDVAQKLIAKGAAITPTTNGQTALNMAILSSTPNPDLVRALIQASADVNTAALGTTPLISAITAGTPNPEIVKLLLDAGANPSTPDSFGNTPLATTVSLNRIDIMNELLKKKDTVDINAIGPQGYTALYLAVLNGNMDAIKALLHAGADPNITPPSTPGAIYYSPLLLAISHENLEMAKELLKGGANPKAPAPNGDTPLSITLLRGNNDILRELLSTKGINVNAKDSANQTPLYLAISTRNLESVQELLKAKADPNIPMIHQSGDTSSPLIHAVSYGDAAIDIVRALLAAGADKNYKDSTGNTALDYAKFRSEDSEIGPRK